MINNHLNPKEQKNLLNDYLAHLNYGVHLASCLRLSKPEWTEERDRIEMLISLLDLPEVSPKTV